jgi:hypothetical protein
MIKPMLVTYRRVVSIPLLPALAAAGIVVIVCGLAGTMLAVVGIVKCSKALFGTFGSDVLEHDAPPRRDHTIEATVVNQSSLRRWDR